MHVPVGKTFSRGRLFDKIGQELLLMGLVINIYYMAAPFLAGFTMYLEQENESNPQLL